MAGDTTITVVGNLTADPELRFTPSGAAVANFTVASTPRIYDRQAGEWKDGEALFLRCNIWLSLTLVTRPQYKLNIGFIGVSVNNYQEMD